MIASAHLAAGIVIGLSTDHLLRGRIARVAIAFVVGVVMHLLMDAVPHADYFLFPWWWTPYLIMGEIAIVGVVAVVLLRDRLTPHWPSSIAAGLLGSVLPDSKYFAPFLLSARDANLVEHYGNMLHAPFHRGATTALGMTTQVLCAVLLLACFAVFPRRAQGNQ